MHQIKSKYLSAIISLGLLWIIVTRAQAVPLIDTVSPTMGQLGQNLEMTIRGSGFSENTRVALIPDSSGREKVLGEINTHDYPTNVTVVCSTAYLVDYAGLKIIDLSDPTDPVLLGEFPVVNANDVAVEGNTAYVVAEDKLILIDVSNPSAPQPIDSFTVPKRYAFAVTVVDSIAYVLAGELLLVGVDPAGPDYLKVMGSTDAGSGVDIIVKADIAYVATDALRTLQIIDVSTPASPQPLGIIHTPGDATSVAVDGSTAYVTHLGQEGPRGMLIADVSDPGHPFVLSSFETPGDPFRILIRENLAYVDVLQSGLLAIDIGDPGHPFLLGWIKKIGRGIAFIEGTPYMAVSHNTGLQVMDVGNLSYPTIMGSVVTPGCAYRVSASGNIVVIGEYHGLQLVDAADVLHPMIVGSVPISQYTDITDVKVIGSRLYFTKHAYGEPENLEIYDISTPSAPVHLGSYTASVRLFNFDVAGTMAYILDGNGDLHIVDVSDPAAPGLPKLLDITGHSGDVAVLGNYAYVASNGAGVTPDDKGSFMVIDVSDPELAEIKGSLARVYNAPRISVAGNRAYIADGFNGWEIIDTSDATQPAVLGSYDQPGIFFGDITIDGNTAYIAVGEPGFHVVDVSDPESPVFIGQVEILGEAQGITVVDGLANVVGCHLGLSIIPVAREITTLTQVDSTELVATLPAPPAAGSYTIRVFDDSGEALLPGAVTFLEQLPKAKAIIVAGYGPHSTNKVWEETQLNAGHAYQVLLNQGYAKEDIRYLSAVSVDVDNDGISDVYGDADLDTLEQSILYWGADADDLILYLIGHGSAQSFEIKHTGTTSEFLQADALAGMLNNLQNSTGKRMVFLYDACYSGSFIDPVKIPAGKTFERVMMTSSTRDRVALLGNNGTTSFSYHFWESVYAGNDLTQSFSLAAGIMQQYDQTPLLDGNCDGVPNTPSDSLAEGTVGRGYNFALPAKPYITCHSANLILHKTMKADFWLKTVSAYPVTRVWAEIIPPGYDPLSPNAPDLQTFDLVYSNTNGRFEGSYDNFFRSGTYLVSFYAVNDRQNVSLPGVSRVTVPHFPWNMYIPAFMGRSSSD